MRSAERRPENAMRPLEALHAWFQVQHRVVQGGIAERLAFLAPNVLTPPLDLERTGPDSTDVWIAQIDAALAKGVGTMTPWAFTLFMRSVIGFCFVGARPDPAGERQFLEMAEEAGVEAAAATTARRLEALPFRERLWERALTMWAELCQGALSDEAIHRWLRGGPDEW
jgi:hypothetical protein